MFSFQRITFVGFGLLASSLAAAIKQAKSKVIIRAVSSPKTLERAKELQIADETFGYEEMESWVEGSDVILLCTPISVILSFLKTAVSTAKSTTVMRLVSVLKDLQ